MYNVIKKIIAHILLISILVSINPNLFDIKKTNAFFDLKWLYTSIGSQGSTSIGKNNDVSNNEKVVNVVYFAIKGINKDFTTKKDLFIESAKLACDPDIIGINSSNNEYPFFCKKYIYNDPNAQTAPYISNTSCENRSYCYFKEKFDDKNLSERIKRYALDVQLTIPNTYVYIDYDTKDITKLYDKLYGMYFGQWKLSDQSINLIGLVLIGDWELPTVKVGDHIFNSMIPITDFTDTVYIYNSGSNIWLGEPGKKPKPEIWHGIISPANILDKNINVLLSGEYHINYKLNTDKKNGILSIYLDKIHEYHRSGMVGGKPFDETVFHFDPLLASEKIGLTNTKVEDILANLEHWVYNRWSHYINERNMQKMTDNMDFKGNGDTDNDGKLDPINGVDDDADGVCSTGSSLIKMINTTYFTGGDLITIKQYNTISDCINDTSIKCNGIFTGNNIPSNIADRPIHIASCSGYLTLGQDGSGIDEDEGLPFVSCLNKNLQCDDDSGKNLLIMDVDHDTKISCKDILELQYPVKSKWVKNQLENCVKKLGNNDSYASIEDMRVYEFEQTKPKEMFGKLFSDDYIGDTRNMYESSGRWGLNNLLHVIKQIDIKTLYSAMYVKLMNDNLENLFNHIVAPQSFLFTGTQIIPITRQTDATGYDDSVPGLSDIIGINKYEDNTHNIPLDKARYITYNQLGKSGDIINLSITEKRIAKLINKERVVVYMYNDITDQYVPVGDKLVDLLYLANDSWSGFDNNWAEVYDPKNRPYQKADGSIDKTQRCFTARGTPYTNDRYLNKKYVLGPIEDKISSAADYLYYKFPIIFFLAGEKMVKEIFTLSKETAGGYLNCLKDFEYLIGARSHYISALLHPNENELNGIAFINNNLITSISRYIAPTAFDLADQWQGYYSGNIAINCNGIIDTNSKKLCSDNKDKIKTYPNILPIDNPRRIVYKNIAGDNNFHYPMYSNALLGCISMFTIDLKSIINYSINSFDDIISFLSNIILVYKKAEDCFNNDDVTGQSQNTKLHNIALDIAPVVIDAYKPNFYDVLTYINMFLIRYPMKFDFQKLNSDIITHGGFFDREDMKIMKKIIDTAVLSTIYQAWKKILLANTFIMDNFFRITPSTFECIHGYCADDDYNLKITVVQTNKIDNYKPDHEKLNNQITNKISRKINSITNIIMLFNLLINNVNEESGYDIVQNDTINRSNNIKVGADDWPDALYGNVKSVLRNPEGNNRMPKYAISWDLFRLDNKGYLPRSFNDPYTSANEKICGFVDTFIFPFAGAQIQGNTKCNGINEPGNANITYDINHNSLRWLKNNGKCKLPDVLFGANNWGICDMDKGVYNKPHNFNVNIVQNKLAFAGEMEMVCKDYAYVNLRNGGNFKHVMPYITVSKERQKCYTVKVGYPPEEKCVSCDWKITITQHKNNLSNYGCHRWVEINSKRRLGLFNEGCCGEGVECNLPKHDIEFSKCWDTEAFYENGPCDDINHMCDKFNGDTMAIYRKYRKAIEDVPTCNVLKPYFNTWRNPHFFYDHDCNGKEYTECDPSINEAGLGRGLYHSPLGFGDHKKLISNYQSLKSGKSKDIFDTVFFGGRSMVKLRNIESDAFKNPVSNGSIAIKHINQIPDGRIQDIIITTSFDREKSTCNFGNFNSQGIYLERYVRPLSDTLMFDINPVDNYYVDNGFNLNSVLKQFNNQSYIPMFISNYQINFVQRKYTYTIDLGNWGYDYSKYDIRIPVEQRPIGFNKLLDNDYDNKSYDNEEKRTWVPLMVIPNIDYYDHKLWNEKYNKYIYGCEFPIAMINLNNDALWTKPDGYYKIQSVPIDDIKPNTELSLQYIAKTPSIDVTQPYITSRDFLQANKVSDALNSYISPYVKYTEMIIHKLSNGHYSRTANMRFDYTKEKGISLKDTEFIIKDSLTYPHKIMYNIYDAYFKKNTTYTQYLDDEYSIQFGIPFSFQVRMYYYSIVHFLHYAIYGALNYIAYDNEKKDSKIFPSGYKNSARNWKEYLIFKLGSGDNIIGKQKYAEFLQGKLDDVKKVFDEISSDCYTKEEKLNPIEWNLYNIQKGCTNTNDILRTLFVLSSDYDKFMNYLKRPYYIGSLGYVYEPGIVVFKNLNVLFPLFILTPHKWQQYIDPALLPLNDDKLLEIMKEIIKDPRYSKIGLLTTPGRLQSIVRDIVSKYGSGIGFENGKKFYYFPSLKKEILKMIHQRLKDCEAVNYLRIDCESDISVSYAISSGADLSNTAILNIARYFRDFTTKSLLIDSGFDASKVLLKPINDVIGTVSLLYSSQTNDRSFPIAGTNTINILIKEHFVSNRLPNMNCIDNKPPKGYTCTTIKISDDISGHTQWPYKDFSGNEPVLNLERVIEWLYDLSFGNEQDISKYDAKSLPETTTYTEGGKNGVPTLSVLGSWVRYGEVPSPIQFMLGDAFLPTNKFLNNVSINTNVGLKYKKYNFANDVLRIDKYENVCTLIKRTEQYIDPSFNIHDIFHKEILSGYDIGDVANKYRKIAEVLSKILKNSYLEFLCDTFINKIDRNLYGAPVGDIIKVMFDRYSKKKFKELSFNVTKTVPPKEFGIIKENATFGSYGAGEFAISVYNSLFPLWKGNQKYNKYNQNIIPKNSLLGEMMTKLDNLISDTYRDNVYGFIKSSFKDLPINAQSILIDIVNTSIYYQDPENKNNKYNYDNFISGEYIISSGSNLYMYELLYPNTKICLYPLIDNNPNNKIQKNNIIDFVNKKCDKEDISKLIFRIDLDDIKSGNIYMRNTRNIDEYKGFLIHIQTIKANVDIYLSKIYTALTMIVDKDINNRFVDVFLETLANPDKDNDGILNQYDLDCDNDGIMDFGDSIYIRNIPTKIENLSIPKLDENKFQYNCFFAFGIQPSNTMLTYIMSSVKDNNIILNIPTYEQNKLSYKDIGSINIPVNQPDNVSSPDKTYDQISGDVSGKDRTTQNASGTEIADYFDNNKEEDVNVIYKSGSDVYRIDSDFLDKITPEDLQNIFDTHKGKLIKIDNNVTKDDIDVYWAEPIGKRFYGITNTGIEIPIRKSPGAIVSIEPIFTRDLNKIDQTSLICENIPSDLELSRCFVTIKETGAQIIMQLVAQSSGKSNSDKYISEPFTVYAGYPAISDTTIIAMAPSSIVSYMFGANFLSNTGDILGDSIANQYLFGGYSLNVITSTYDKKIHGDSIISEDPNEMRGLGFIGFSKDNSINAILAGDIIGNAVYNFLDESMILLGDPTIKLPDNRYSKKELTDNEMQNNFVEKLIIKDDIDATYTINDVSQSPFTKDVGIPLNTFNTKITSINNLNFNNDKFLDLLIGYNDNKKFAVYKNNPYAYPRFVFDGELLSFHKPPISVVTGQFWGLDQPSGIAVLHQDLSLEIYKLTIDSSSDVKLDVNRKFYDKFVSDYLYNTQKRADDTIPNYINQIAIKQDKDKDILLILDGQYRVFEFSNFKDNGNADNYYVGKIPLDDVFNEVKSSIEKTLNENIVYLKHVNGKIIGTSTGDILISMPTSVFTNIDIDNDLETDKIYYPFNYYYNNNIAKCNFNTTKIYVGAELSCTLSNLGTQNGIAIPTDGSFDIDIKDLYTRYQGKIFETEDEMYPIFIKDVSNSITVKFNIKLLPASKMFYLKEGNVLGNDRSAHIFVTIESHSGNILYQDSGNTFVRIVPHLNDLEETNDTNFIDDTKDSDKDGIPDEIEKTNTACWPNNANRSNRPNWNNPDTNNNNIIDGFDDCNDNEIYDINEVYAGVTDFSDNISNYIKSTKKPYATNASHSIYKNATKTIRKDIKLNSYFDMFAKKIMSFLTCNAGRIAFPFNYVVGVSIGIPPINVRPILSSSFGAFVIGRSLTQSTCIGWLSPGLISWGFVIPLPPKNSNSPGANDKLNKKWESIRAAIRQRIEDVNFDVRITNSFAFIQTKNKRTESGHQYFMEAINNKSYSLPSKAITNSYLRNALFGNLKMHLNLTFGDDSLPLKDLKENVIGGGVTREYILDPIKEEFNAKSSIAKAKKVINAFPEKITTPLTRLIEELDNRLKTPPRIIIKYPDVKNAMKKVKDAIQDEKPNEKLGLASIANFLNNLPFIIISEQKVIIKLPFIDKNSIQKFLNDLKKWDEDMIKSLKELCISSNSTLSDVVLDGNGEFKITGDCPIGRWYANELNKIRNGIIKWIQFLEEIQKLPSKILALLNIREKYMQQIARMINDFNNWIGGWINKNLQIIEKWLKMIGMIFILWKKIKMILDIVISLNVSCAKCKQHRSGQLLRTSIFFGVVTPSIDGIVDSIINSLPKWPDIVIDVSQIKPLEIVLPHIQVQVEPLKIPNLPRFSFSLDLKPLNYQFPSPPSIPKLPTLPNLPKLNLPKLPTLPQPPNLAINLPDFSFIINLTKLLEKFLKILCFIINNYLVFGHYNIPIFPGWHTIGVQVSDPPILDFGVFKLSLGSGMPYTGRAWGNKCEILTQRPIFPLLSIDLAFLLNFNFRLKSITWPDLIEILIKVKLPQFNLAQMIQKFVDENINKFTRDFTSEIQNRLRNLFGSDKKIRLNKNFEKNNKYVINKDLYISQNIKNINVDMEENKFFTSVSDLKYIYDIFQKTNYTDQINTLKILNSNVEFIDTANFNSQKLLNIDFSIPVSFASVTSPSLDNRLNPYSQDNLPRKSDGTIVNPKDQIEPARLQSFIFLERKNPTSNSLIAESLLRINTNEDIVYTEGPFNGADNDNEIIYVVNNTLYYKERQPSRRYCSPMINIKQKVSDTISNKHADKIKDVSPNDSMYCNDNDIKNNSIEIFSENDYIMKYHNTIKDINDFSQQCNLKYIDKISNVNIFDEDNKSVKMSFDGGSGNMWMYDTINISNKVSPYGQIKVKHIINDSIFNDNYILSKLNEKNPMNILNAKVNHQRNFISKTGLFNVVAGSMMIVYGGSVEVDGKPINTTFTNYSINFIKSAQVKTSNTVYVSVPQEINDVNKNNISDTWEKEIYGNVSTTYKSYNDDDKDGISNMEEYIYGLNPKVPNDITNISDDSNNKILDKDFDGILDSWELRNNLSPDNSFDAFEDLDRDGLTNYEEYLFNTKIDKTDTDNDFIIDGEEVDLKLDPTISNYKNYDFTISGDVYRNPPNDDINVNNMQMKIASYIETGTGYLSKLDLYIGENKPYFGYMFNESINKLDTCINMLALQKLRKSINPRPKTYSKKGAIIDGPSESYVGIPLIFNSNKSSVLDDDQIVQVWWNTGSEINQYGSGVEINPSNGILYVSNNLLVIAYDAPGIYAISLGIRTKKDIFYSDSVVIKVEKPNIELYPLSPYYSGYIIADNMVDPQIMNNFGFNITIESDRGRICNIGSDCTYTFDRVNKNIKLYIPPSLHNEVKLSKYLQLHIKKQGNTIYKSNKIQSIDWTDLNKRFLKKIDETYNVKVEIIGSGKVVSNIGEIECTPDPFSICDADLPIDTQNIILEVDDANFIDWGTDSDCDNMYKSGNKHECIINKLDSGKTVQAIFK